MNKSQKQVPAGISAHEQAVLTRILGGNMPGRPGEDPRRTLLQALAGSMGLDGKAYDPSVERTGDKIILPEGANLDDVIAALERQNDFEQQETTIHVTLPVAPWDGAHALQAAIKDELGIFNQMSSFDGNVHQIDVEVELGKTIQIPWGTFELPGMDGATVTTDTGFEDGRVVFKCHVSCERRYEKRIRKLLDKTRELATTESLHKGKAFSIAFTDASGEPQVMPKPKFFEFTDEVPFFNRDLEDSIERNILVPILYAAERKKQGKSLKRGVLFAGEYGTGKTLLASHIARAATKAGWTFIYVKNPLELPQALRWATQYQPVVVFAEDTERVAGQDRTDKVNDLLNQLDGIDGKTAEILTVMTSNHLDKINPAMRRKGRIDLVVPVLPPNAETVVRMVKALTGAMLQPKADLAGVGEILAGEIPANIKEVVNRAELEATRRTGKVGARITAADLEAVAREVKAESDLFKDQGVHSKNHAALAAEGLEGLAAGLRKNGAAGAPMVGHA